MQLISSSVVVAYWEALLATVATGCEKPSEWEAMECIKCVLEKGFLANLNVFCLIFMCVLWRALWSSATFLAIIASTNRIIHKKLMVELKIYTLVIINFLWAGTS